MDVSSSTALVGGIDMNTATVEELCDTYNLQDVDPAFTEDEWTNITTVKVWLLFIY
jgi:hypothetical protein